MNPGNEQSFHTEWIERYLLGELQGEELEQFIQRLRIDSAFQREVTLQRTIVEQSKQVGRADMRQELKALHQQLGFAQGKRRVLAFPFYAVAAAIAFLLIVTTVFYFFNHNRTIPDASSTSDPKGQPIPATLAFIRFQASIQDPSMGFSGTKADSTTPILLYPAIATSPAYQFDDTLRLYGTFTPSQLALQYHPSTEQYTLLLDSTAYSLQRYRPIQALNIEP
jgi:uncharacterized coiled-coil protein SlyX